MTDHSLKSAAAVRQDRLWKRHMAMAKIGAIPGNGVNRQALTQEDIRARALLIAWADARGYQVSVDDIANLFIRRPGSQTDAPPVLIGSHMDSQPMGDVSMASSACLPVSRSWKLWTMPRLPPNCQSKSLPGPMKKADGFSRCHGLCRVCRRS